MKKIIEIQLLDGYRIHLGFNDGFQGSVDLSDLVGKGVFALWSDRQAFEQVRIGAGGELVWSEQIDLCPDSLYLRATGKNPTELFPALTLKTEYA